MKILSYNVNGLRAILKKDNIIDNKKSKNNTFENFITKNDFDIVCLSEIKISCQHSNILNNILPQYKYKYYNICDNTSSRNGVCIFSKIKPININYDLNHNKEGRFIELEFEKFYLVFVYNPNSGAKLERLKFRTEDWDVQLLKKLNLLKKKKEVLLCGDLNVIPDEHGTYNFKTQHNKLAGVTDNEMNNFNKLLNNGFINIQPKKIKYTYFSYRFQARKYNKGMILDYFISTPKLIKKIKNIKILNNIYGSDHLPILLTIK